MKKWFACLLALCLCCASVAGMAAAGVYEGAAQGFGGEVKAALTIDEQGAITSVKLSGENETPAIGGAALETLETAILSAQGTEIDAVAGATITSNAVKEAATAALQAAGLVQVQDAPMKAGTYTHTYLGYCSDVTVETTISDDAIAAVNIVAQDETVGIGS